MSNQHQLYVPPNGVQIDAHRALPASQSQGLVNNHSSCCFDSQAQRSADSQWDRNGRPLDVARSRQPQNYGTPLPTAVDDWSRANEIEQHAIQQPSETIPGHWPTELQQPQPTPKVYNQQKWRNADAAADSAYPVRQPHTSGAANQTLRPTASVSVMKEVLVETQPATTETQRSSSMIAVRQHSVTVAATGPQTLVAPDHPYTITKDQLKVATARGEPGDGMTPEQGFDVVATDGAISEQPSKPKRKASFKTTLERAGSKVSNVLLTALRSGVDKPSAKSSADKIMAGWQSFISGREQQEMAKEGAFDHFQGMIERAMDSKYKELKGEGCFLLGEETVDLATQKPIELPVEQEEPAALNEEESIWLTYTKKEEQIIEFRDPYTGSVKRSCLPSESPRVSGGYLICYPPTPRVYTARSQSPAQAIRSEGLEPSLSGQQNSTPSPKNGCSPTHLEAEMEDGRLKSPSPAHEKESRLPRPTARVDGKPVSSHRATSVQSSATQPAEVSKFREPSKGRKDSVQPVAPQAAQTPERYTMYQHMGKK